MQNLYIELLNGLLGGGAKNGTPAAGNPDQVRTQPVYRTPPSANGGLLGSNYGASPYQSFNPFGSASASVFDQYMNQAMRMYPGAGGFFGFNGYQFPTNTPTQPAANATPPVGSTPWQQQNSWWGNNVGGGN